MYDLRIVDVADLPSFHNAFKCANRELFEVPVHDARRAAAARLVQPYHPESGNRARRFLWQFWRSTAEKRDAEAESRRAAIERDIEHLLRHEVPDCIMRELGPLATLPPLIDQTQEQEITRRVRAELTPAQLSVCPRHAANWRRIADVACELLEKHGDRLTWEIVSTESDRLPNDDGAWFRSLFEDPIDWSPGELGLVDGQHRACALVASGASRVPVEPGPIELRHWQEWQRRQLEEPPPR